ncbi:mono-functional DNA-alkylating methyl methanesulfonate N-term-domain-containing protein [Dichotomopilus funicola]|uniref:Eukaryotic translation initiation factor 5B n=1 Tax=Dichotomopilus funicola TaxID=1934379 RepID=A0AAN6V975_9PEZI|nr:mono-functional DNA-alkylating methyl methanesulfonate N-term-domain-containing protein [Dichotomopilus funicola]
MAFQTNIFRDGEWVTETVNLQAVLESQKPGAKGPTKQDPLKPPQCGLLTTTVAESDQVKLVLHASLRSEKHSDVVLVGDTFIQLCELGTDGRLHHTIRKIGTLMIPGLEGAARRDGTFSTAIKTEERRSRPFSLFPPSQPATTDTQFPPQFLVLALETGDSVCLFVQSGPDGAPTLEASRLRGPRYGKGHAGFHLAVNPSSRYMAMAGPTDSFTVYELETHDELNRRYLSGERLNPVRSFRLRSVRGVIHKMEFLYPRAEDEHHIILLLVIVRRGRSKTVIYEWALGDDLKHVLSEEKQGHRMPVEHQMPLMLIPLKVQSAFIAVSAGHIAVYTECLHGPPKFVTMLLPPHPPTERHRGHQQPLMTAWTRAIRRRPHSDQQDWIYLAREDGVVFLLRVDEDAQLESHPLGPFSCNISSAATCVFEDSSDILILGSETGPGGYWKMVARGNGEFLGSLPNCSPVVDFTTTDNFTGWHREAHRDKNMVPWKQGRFRNPDRIFATSEGENGGSITEFRYGLKASIGLDLDYGPGDIPLFDGYILLVSLPDSTEVLLLSEDFSSAQPAVPSAIPYDLSSTTLDMWNAVGVTSLPGLTDTSVSDAAVSHDHIAVSTHTDAKFEVHVFKIDTRTFSLHHLRTVNVEGEITCLALGHNGLIGDDSESALGTSLVLDGIESMIAGNDVVLAGTRSGEVVMVKYGVDGTSVKFERFGTTATNITTSSSTKIGVTDPTILACCDNTLVSIGLHPENDCGVAATGTKTKVRVWPVDASNSGAASPPVQYATTVDMPCSPGTVPIFMVSGTRLLLAEMRTTPGSVHRSISVDGVPNRVIYCPFTQCLVAAVNKPSGPTLKFIDPDTGEDIGVPTDKHKVPQQCIAGLGKQDDRITGLADWNYKRDGHVWNFVLVTTKGGRLIVVTAEKVASQDGSPTVYRYWTRYRQEFKEPIYSVIGYDEGLIFCCGHTLHWEVLDIQEKRLKPLKSFALGSPATGLRISNGKLVALTSRESLIVLDNWETEGEATKLSHIDPWRRNGIDSIEIAGPQQLVEAMDGVVTTGGIHLLADREGGVAGLWVPWQTPDKECEVVMEAELPSSIRKFHRGRTRPYWEQGLRVPQYGRLPATLDDAEILGVSLSGAMYQFTLLSVEAWRLLRFMQNLAGSCPELSPVVDQIGDYGGGVDPSSPPYDGDASGLNMEPKLAYGMEMHVDGDLLKRCSEKRMVERIIGPHFDRFTELLSDVVDEEKRKWLKEKGGNEAYFRVAYDILELLPRPETQFYGRNDLSSQLHTINMAPKKKGNKKGGDDWEAELGESIAPVDAGATPAADAGEADDEPSAGGGGLMNLMRKNKEKRKKKGLVDEDEAAETAADAVPETLTLPDLSAKAPEEANLEDEFALPEKKGKGGKGKQQHQQKGGAAAKDEDADESGRVLTKAEKEKLKKEREKQRKKEQAAKKKAGGPAKAEPAKAAAAEEKPEAPAAAAPAAAEAGGKKKKLPAHLLALQKQQEELRRQQEEAERRREEEKRRAEEEERLDAEEKKRREEEKARKKQKEKERIEQLKREGKYMTKAQKEEKARNERKLQQMIAAGIKVGGLEGDEGEKEKEKEKERKKPEIDEEKALEEAAERARLQAEAAAKEAEEKARAEREKAEAEAAAAAAAAEEDSVEDDWEAAAASDKEDVKDSWDADSEDEAEKKAKSAKPQNEEDEDEDEDDEDDSDEDSEEDEKATQARLAEIQRKKEAAERREKAHQAALAARSKDNLRSPICCILGHVDTGKTKLLDKIRQTNVQEGEAGGITQQIGATYFPVEAIKQKTAVVNPDGKFEFKVPGLLIIDTPGHESFSNLRSRGSSLCNIAILVVDIMHGLEPQTLESMKMLRDRKTPFIVALNKIDRLYGWKKIDNNGFRESLALQNKAVQNEFKNRLEETKLAFAEQGFNSELFYENKSMARYVSLVPTSAHTGEGIPDMLKLIVQLTQERMVGSLMYLSEVQATVLEVKAIEGFGMTIDVILSNGILREGDRIILCGTEGVIKTNIRALLTPAPLKELRLKSQYVHNKEVKAALGVKISAPGLEGAIAGSRMLVVGPDDDESDLEDEVESDLASLFSRVEKSGRGVSVQASTLGSLEALLDFLKVSKIPVANVGIGPVYKRDVMQCGIMLEKAADFAVMLCFDVKVDKEAQSYADEQGIKIFTADIIYHLFDQFTKHIHEQNEKKKEESKMLAVFPCVLNPVAVFNKTNPIVVGVDVVEGSLRINTPISVEIIPIGRVTSIEREHKQIPICKKGQPSVAVKIEMGGHQPTYGRQLEEKDVLYSQISRASIDTLKQFYRADVTNDEWQLIIKLKPMFDVA